MPCLRKPLANDAVGTGDGRQGRIPAVVLAGQRAGSNTPLGEAANVAADVMVPVAGRPSLLRVLDTLTETQCVWPSVVVGPAPSVVADCGELREQLARHEIRWQQPGGDPASSSIAGISGLPTPVLLTAGDHALLTPAVVDEFCSQALKVDADFVVGLVPFVLVHEAFPESRRTVLKFADQPSCGSNLFLVSSPQGVRALELWRYMQQHRKHPQRIARSLGMGLLWKYLWGRLSLADALEALSAKAGCKLAAVTVRHPAAAVDVDSVADWRLAERILSEDLQRA